ncbi:rhombotarget lipoprotein [Shewanella submarina]|uniref:Rhombotarget lipoprotein n=1 Tax=Shewanella submarina TaxID=2016376 RepID=A0ABV7GLC2_9GAMM|nr:rhombotarget lipoprotein [Shewanella submarina]MCL1036168.1 rhombotarget lipoprotein [Shewanella submarina]
MTKRYLWVLFGLLTLASCSQLMSANTGKKSVSSSLSSFLYPDESSRVEHQPQMPLLRLPVTVGLAFVPQANSYGESLNRNSELELLGQVKQAFLERDFIDRIEVIPSTYLQPGGGFTNLDQVARLYDVEVMALVSYDQLSQSSENNAAFLYWTIVGMYLIAGNENQVQTFVDTAVFDVASQKMMFRAPGLSKVEASSSAIRLDETIAAQSNEGFQLAVADMIVNLDQELDQFKTRVKEEKIAKVEHKEGYSGGAVSALFLLFACVALGWHRLAIRRW